MAKFMQAHAKEHRRVKHRSDQQNIERVVTVRNQGGCPHPANENTDKNRLEFPRGNAATQIH
jgi:hypothetical protein